MRMVALVAVVLAAGCSSPTRPTPINQPTWITPPVVVAPPVTAPPVVVTSPPVVTAPTLPTTDPRFDLGFYRMLVHNARDLPLTALYRQREAPRVYLRTIDDAGAPIDALSLNATASAIESVTGKLTGRFGIAGLERGTETRQGQPGWVTVRWGASPDRFCGIGYIGGDLMMLYPKTAGCRCNGGPAIAPLIVKHEMGHVLGFNHTDQRTDLMYPGGLPACDMDPSPREVFHAAVAYGMPIGSPAP